MLTFIKIVSGGKHPKALYRCHCGTEKIITIGHVNSGHTQSCGCLYRPHGESCGQDTPSGKSAEYMVWKSMRARCRYAKTTNFSRYGGRGITVCERWDSSFNNFLEDMGRRPTPLHTLERKDNDGNYCKDNCYWATMTEQNRNRSINTFLILDDRRATLAEWSEITGLKRTTISGRLKRGMTVKQALTAPLVPRSNRRLGMPNDHLDSSEEHQ